MKKALQVTSVASMLDQFTMLNIKVLQDLGYKVDVAANFKFGNTTSNDRVEVFKKELHDNNIEYTNVLFSRNVFSFKNIQAYKKIRALINENNYDIIHCHSPIGGVITRLAARRARKKGSKIYYTAHGFHFYKGASMFNWLIFYPIEYLLSIITDVLIVINKEDFQISNTFFHAKVTKYIPGVGVKKPTINSSQSKSIRSELSLPIDSKLILSVGELNDNKNHSIVIDAMKMIVEQNPNIYYLICGKGNKEQVLKDQCLQNHVEKNVFFLNYRTDIDQILQQVDLFVFPSFREGLSLALMEAMSNGLPIVCSKIRGNVDLVENFEGGLVLENDETEYTKAILSILLSIETSSRMSEYNLNRIKTFGVDVIEQQLIDLYTLFALEDTSL